MPRLDNRELAVRLDALRNEAVGFFEDEISDDQDENLQRYLGEPFGDEVEGRSQVISEDSAQVVDWALPDLLEPFVSGDNIVKFKATRPEDEEWIEQATDYVNQIVFFEDNSGFDVLHDAGKDGLIQKVGITKTVWREERRTEKDNLSGLSAIALQRLRDDDDVEILEQSSKQIEIDQLPLEVIAAFPDGREYEVEIERVISRGRVFVEPVPPEEFKISPRVASLSVAPYCVHESEKTLSDLIEMGFDEDEVMDLPTDERNRIESRRDTRFIGETRENEGNEPGDPLQRKVLLLEEYLQIDWDEDGETEWVQAFRVKNKILGTPEEVDDQPFDVFTPYPIPHRFFGQALVDKAKQSDRINTVLARQMLDNIYLASNPQREVAEDAVTDDGTTYDDLLTFRVGGLVRTKKFGNIREMAIADRSGVALQGLQWFDQRREAVTGVTRGSQGLSAETIDKDQPISAYEARSQDRGQQKRNRLMTRVFAEKYLVPMFKRILRMVVKYQDFKRTVELRGEWVEMDPRSWRANVGAKVNVGLGFPNREEELAGANLILERQVQALELGMTTPNRIFNTVEQIVKAAGQTDVDRFFLDPGSEEFQQLQAQRQQQKPPPDPRLIEVQQRSQIRLLEVQQRGQLEQAKLQADMQIKFADIEARMETDMEKARADLQQKRERVEGELVLQQDKINAEFDLAREKLVAEVALKREEIALEAQLAREQNAAQIGTGNGVGGGVRFGGELG